MIRGWGRPPLRYEPNPAVVTKINEKGWSNSRTGSAPWFSGTDDLVVDTDLGAMQAREIHGGILPPISSGGRLHDPAIRELRIASVTSSNRDANRLAGHMVRNLQRVCVISGLRDESYLPDGKHER